MDTEEPQESWGSAEDLSVATAGLSAESWEIRSHRRMGGSHDKVASSQHEGDRCRGGGS